MWIASLSLILLSLDVGKPFMKNTYESQEILFANYSSSELMERQQKGINFYQTVKPIVVVVHECFITEDDLRLCWVWIFSTFDVLRHSQIAKIWRGGQERRLGTLGHLCLKMLWINLPRWLRTSVWQRHENFYYRQCTMMFLLLSTRPRWHANVGQTKWEMCGDKAGAPFDGQIDILFCWAEAWSMEMTCTSNTLRRSCLKPLTEGVRETKLSFVA